MAEEELRLDPKDRLPRDGVSTAERVWGAAEGAAMVTAHYLYPCFSGPFGIVSAWSAGPRKGVSQSSVVLANQTPCYRRRQAAGETL